MSQIKESQIVEIVEFPVTKDQSIPMTFYFESRKEDVAKVMLEHQAQWIVRELKKYPMPQRKKIYEKLMEKLESS